MRKKQVAVIGAAGRMGQEIASALLRSDTLKPSLGVVTKGLATSYAETIKGLQANSFADIDVIIDFSTAEAFSKNLKFAEKLGKPLVSGVTGLSPLQKKELIRASKKIPLLWSANMSLGVATLVRALQSFSGLSGFDFQVEEFHHNKKKDSPSGTALHLQEKLGKVTKRPLPAPVAIRGGGIYGVHKIYAMSEDEVLVFEHTALNRKLFAKGAVAAAEWLLRQEPGLYEMQEIFE